MDSTLNKKPLDKWTGQERIGAVRKIFSEITPHYDRMNHIMSARRDIFWRSFMVGRMDGTALRVLDLATGTGDVAINTAKQLPDARIFGIDFVREMLDTAVQKTERYNLKTQINYTLADAMHLPFPDKAFDVATIAFGMRNIPDRLGALKEMKRVVKPGGKVMVLEMTFPRNLGMRSFFNWYLNKFIPLLGNIIARNVEAYKYLPASIQDFIHPDILTSMFRETGFTQVKAFPLTLGITYLHEGVIPGRP